MEGFWGLIICVFILYPLAYYYPGDDHGSFENLFNTLTMISNSSSLQVMFVVYFVAILLYNVLACLVTYMLDSVWHAILDNFRPATVWGTDLFIFYFVTVAFGEPWNQPWSWLQMFGMFVLLYGTAIYNAPNAGSVLLKGGLQSCFIDCSDEYEDRVPVVVVDNLSTPISMGSRLGDVVVPANPSPYYRNMSPFVSGSQRRMLISPSQRGAAGTGGTPVGVRRRGDREDYVVVVGGPGSNHLPAGVAASSYNTRSGGGASALSGNSNNLMNVQMVTRGMSFNSGSPNTNPSGYSSTGQHR
jgi:hypothetical protein